MYLFNSQVKKFGSFANNISNDAIKNEPMFFNCDLAFAWENGGKITKDFINNLPLEWSNIDTVFDSRVHMLMPGWYPCIPGWHHDDVPRSTPNGQPNYDNPEYYSEHIIGLVNADIAPTEFALSSKNQSNVFEKVEEEKTIYKEWNDSIEERINNGSMIKYQVPDRTFIEFDWQSFHRGVKANTSGWRWFGRVSKNTDRVNNITNEIRKQVQVYLEFPTSGW